ncbi:MAG TPA: NHLP leader peptide family RiPP precursor [bacterium]|nr:NHLP leader peptide family RiPP precursor [bacterium]
MSQTKNRRQEFTDQLTIRAHEDATFKQRLLANPKATISEVLGISIPDDVAVTVLEEKPNQLYIVLPVNPADIELPVELLDKVAGGGSGCSGSC